MHVVCHAHVARSRFLANITCHSRRVHTPKMHSRLIINFLSVSTFKMTIIAPDQNRVRTRRQQYPKKKPSKFCSAMMISKSLTPKIKHSTRSQLLSLPNKTNPLHGALRSKSESNSKSEASFSTPGQRPKAAEEHYSRNCTTTHNQPTIQRLKPTSN